MNSTEFIALSDAIFKRIDTAIEAASLDVDTVCQGNVLELDFDSGDKIIVNRNEALQELWIAAKSGGYHFVHRDGLWLSTRNSNEFFATLAAVITASSGEKFIF